MSALKMTAKVRSQVRLASDIYSLVLYAPEIAEQAKAGQFVSLYSKDGANLLPIPILSLKHITDPTRHRAN